MIRSAAALILVLGLWLSPQSAIAVDRGDAQSLVNASAETLRNFARDPDLPWLRNNIQNARAILVAPSVVKGGFIIGGSGGNGVLIARAGGSWTDPAFYTLGSVTFGFQIGAEVSEVVLLVMTERGLNALLSDSFKLGGDVSVAAGPVGAGAKAQVTDIIAFTRSQGLYGGINLEGAIVDVRSDFNRAYYGRATTPSEIVITRSAKNPGAKVLIDAARAVR